MATKKYDVVDAQSVVVDGTDINNRLNGYNYIINGDMRISQRGDFSSPTPILTNNYHLDRWFSYSNLITSSVTQITSNQPSTFPYGTSLRITATSSGSSGMGIGQKIENYTVFKQKDSTVGVWVKSNSPNCRVFLYDTAFTNSVTHSGSGNWEFLTLTRNVAFNTSQLRLYVLISDSSAGDVSISHTDENGSGEAAYVEFTAAKLEIGSVATPFVPRLLTEELTLCQRYYEKSYAQDRYAGHFIDYSYYAAYAEYTSSATFASVGFKVTKARTPSVTFYSYLTGTANTVYSVDAATDLTVQAYNTNDSKATVQNLSGGTRTGRFYFHFVADAEL